MPGQASNPVKNVLKSVAHSENLTRSDEPSMGRFVRAGRYARATHSYRRATIGSTLVARRVGTKIANNATTVRKIETPMNVRGSNGLRSSKTAANSRAAKAAPAAPHKIPITV